MTDEAVIPEAPESIPATNDRLTARQRAWLAIGALVFLAIAAGVVAAVVAMVRHPAETETIRDVFIILMAFESLVVGLALVILIVQLARLTSLLQNEVKPILESTNETINTLRGTTHFLSNNLVEPVVKVNSSMAAVRRVLELLRFGRGK
jgi:hypothetical protein